MSLLSLLEMDYDDEEWADGDEGLLLHLIQQVRCYDPPVFCFPAALYLLVWLCVILFE